VAEGAALLMYLSLNISGTLCAHMLAKREWGKIMKIIRTLLLIALLVIVAAVFCAYILSTDSVAYGEVRGNPGLDAGNFIVTITN
jgi:hypothetical protein